MSNPTADFPTTIHTDTDISALASQKLGTSSPKHSEVEGKQEEEIKAVQTKIGTGSSTPTLGKALVGNGTGTSHWGTVDEILPSQTGNNGFYLKTDGTSSSWAAGGGGGGGGSNTFSNQNAAGVGVYDGTVGTDVEFRGIAGANNKVTTALNTTDKTVEITLDESHFDKSAMGLDNVLNVAQVQLQATTPGSAQTGNLNITGTAKVGNATIGTLSGMLKASSGVVSGSATTDNLTEGSTNLYYTNTRARANRLDQMAAPTASVSMNSQLVTNVADGVSTGDAVNKGQLDALLASNDAMIYKGVINCSLNPNYPAADAGDTYKVSVAGKIGGGSGPNVEIGDTLICTVDSTASGTHAGVGANWTILQTNIDGAVVGPASSTNANLASFSGTGGKVIADSGYSTASFAPAAGSSSITTLGTVATGTWNGATIGPGYGGTGLTSFTKGDLIAASGTSTLAKLGVGTDTYALVADSAQTTGLNWSPVPKQLFECTVAASGGDYTTLGAALAAGKASIFIRRGTYTETTNLSSYTLSSKTLYIQGEDRENTIVQLAASSSGWLAILYARSTLSNFTIKLGASTGLSANTQGWIHSTVDDLTLDNMNIIPNNFGQTGAVVVVNGANRNLFRNCRFNGGTPNGGSISLQGAPTDTKVLGCSWVETGTAALRAVYGASSSGVRTIIANCSYSTSASYGEAFTLNHIESIIESNEVNVTTTSSSANSTAISTGDYSIVANNRITTVGGGINGGTSNSVVGNNVKLWNTNSANQPTGVSGGVNSTVIGNYVEANNAYAATGVFTNSGTIVGNFVQNFTRDDATARGTGIATLGTNSVCFGNYVTNCTRYQNTEATGRTDQLKTVSASGATTTIDVRQDRGFKVTLSANTTIAFTENVDSSGTIMNQKAAVFRFHLIQDATGSRTVTWPASVVWAGGAAPTLTTTASKRDIVEMQYDTAALKYYAYVVGQNF